MTPTEEFFASLGDAPWSQDEVLRQLKVHGIKRLSPTDMQVILMLSEFELGDEGISDRIVAAGIAIDRGDGEPVF